jgi:hypothetical protein
MNLSDHINGTGIKLFASDLDGTILTDEKIVSPKTREALRRFVEAGNHFAICTGRDINSGRKVYESLGLDLPGSFVIAYNGGQIYDVDKGETIYRIRIEQNLVREIFDFARKQDMYVHTYNDEYIISPFGGECLDYYRIVIKTRLRKAQMHWTIWTYLLVRS